MQNYAALKQLPFAGKQTLPATIRKDIWRPLLSVSFPSAPQGLSAFRKLREYRKLHELSWNTHTVPNAGLLDLENPYVRVNTVRPPRKERSRMIMDQRANSIADLAQVLREQEQLGAETEKQRIEREQAEETRVREELISLAEEERNGGLPVLEAAIQAQESAINDMRARKQAAQPDAPSRKDVHRQILALNALKLKHQKMIAAKDTFEQGHARLIKQAESKSESGELKQGASELELDIEPPAIFYRPTERSGSTPRRGNVKQEVAKKQTPVYTAQGIVIRWSNPLDAEFAESWPTAVEHQDAGYTRHVAARPGDEAILDAEAMLRSPKALEEMRIAEEGGLDELEARMSESPDHFIQPGKASDARA